MRPKQQIKSETNSTVYIHLRRLYWRCSHCPAHRVENRGRIENSWKVHRKTRWRREARVHGILAPNAMAPFYYDLNEQGEPIPLPDTPEPRAVLTYWARWEKQRVRGSAEYQRYTVADVEDPSGRRLWAFFDGFNRYGTNPPLVWTLATFRDGKVVAEEFFPTKTALLEAVRLASAHG